MPKIKIKNDSPLPIGEEYDRSVATPCSLEEVELHLQAFIREFVVPDEQSRWRELLIDRRSEWDRPLPKTHPNPRHIKMVHKIWHLFMIRSVDSRYCRQIPNGQRVATTFDAMVGKGPGVYYSPGNLPCRMVTMEASELLYKDDSNALLSFQPGKKALFFAHSNGVWLCEKA
jgi:hypothetical protein